MKWLLRAVSGCLALTVLPLAAHTSAEQGPEMIGSLIEISLVFLLLALLLLRHYRRRKEKALTEQTQLLSAMIESLPDIVAYKDKEGVYQLFNSHASQFFGLTARERTGRRDEDIFDPVTCKLIRHQDRDARQRRPQPRHEAWLENAEGNKVLLECYRQPMFDAAHTYIGLVFLCRDITQSRQQQENLEYLARHDTLTGLINRNMLHEQLNFALQMTRRNNECIALVFIDLDRFKDINDSLGHNIGDLLLRDVAHRLKSNLRDSDICARIGGDEFVIALSQVEEEHVQEKCDQLLQKIAQPYHLQGHLLTVCASAGIAISPQHGNSAESLMLHADAALNRAKAQGRNCSYVYSEKLTINQHNQLSLEQDLRKAYAGNEFQLVFHPQWRTGNARPERVEALIRWPHKTRGMVSPHEFIPLAETTGMIMELGLWVLRTSCLQFLHWREEGLMLEKIAVNVSAMQINSRFADTVENILRELNFDPHWLELEVTESLMMSGITEVSQQVHKLRELGVEFSIDDFGTGYSSLSKLKSMPVSVLKIDQSFVRNVHKEANDYEIVRAIIAMARSLGLTVVAEGVENQEQEDTLRNLGCEWLQGYLYGNPVSGEDFSREYSADGSEQTNVNRAE